MKSIRIVSLLFIYLGLLTITSIIFIQGTSYESASKQSSVKNSLRSIALVESDYYVENGKYFLTIEGNQTKNINNILFSGKKTLNEDGYYGFYILSEGDSGFKACTTIPSSIGQSKKLANYCVNHEGQLWKLPKIVSQPDYQFKNLEVLTLEPKTIVGESTLSSYSYWDVDTDLTEEDSLVYRQAEEEDRKAKEEYRQARLESRKADEDYRIAKHEVANPFNPIFSSTLWGAATDAPLDKEGKQTYLNAHRLLAAGQYSQAIDLFLNYLDLYPENNHVPDAFYWLGKAYVAKGDYHNGKKIFIEFQNDYPLHHKFSNSLYELAMTHHELKETKEAEQLLESMIKEFPNHESIFQVKASLKSIQAPESEKNKKILRFDHEKLAVNKISLTNQNQVLNIIYLIGIGIVFILVFILVENYVPYRGWLRFSHFYRSHSKSKLTIFSRWVVAALVVILFFAILIKLTLSIVTTGLPEFLSLYLLRIDEFLGIQDFLNSYGIYFNTASQIKSAQYLFGVPAIFSLIAIAIILHSKKKLLVYATKLAKGDNVEPPKIRLQEFSEIVNSIDTLQHKLKGKKYIETFMSSIAHEIRTPLIGIKENTKILNLSMNEKDFIQSKNNILESNFRMTKIIDSLLQLSQLEQPDKNLKKDKFNIKEAIANILNDPDIEKKIKDKNISIKKINLNVFLEGNQALIEMCLSNVLNNAIDFSFKDKDISIKVIETEENISIKILDKGVGIPDNILDKIQDKFVSTSRPYTKKRSTGLGLNLVKIIMELHDGIFEINNRQDVKGVVVKLTFSK